MRLKNLESILENASTEEIKKARLILAEILDEAIASADPKASIKNHVKLEGGRLKVGGLELDVSGDKEIVVVGGGKAGGAMAEAIEEIMGERISRGIVAVPEGASPLYHLKKIRLIEAGHPLPNEGSLAASNEIISTVSNLSQEDLVICLLSGGGSTLLTSPAPGINLNEIKETTNLLLKSGANIKEINAVRKHLSKIKGGQLARAAYPARTLTLLISDVVGDSIDTIASGPTAPDPTTYKDALEVLKKYGLIDKVAKSIIDHLIRGERGEIPETPKPGEKYFNHAYWRVVASNADAINAAAEVGKKHGLNVSIFSKKMQGEARDVGKVIAWLARKMIDEKKENFLILSGGETTVTVRGDGLGGRNQELALSASIELAGLKKVGIISFSTDGIDGPTDAAGAIADGFTVRRARELGLDPMSYLERNDSYHFFKNLKDLLITGQTGTNVMDLVAVVSVND